MLMEAQKNDSIDCYFFKNKFDFNNNNCDNNLIVLPSSICGDDSIEDNYKIINDIKKNLKDKFDVNLNNFQHEVDQKGYKNIINLVKTKVLDLKVNPGTFHILINILRSIFKTYYFFPFQQLASHFKLSNDFSKVNCSG